MYIEPRQEDEDRYFIRKCLEAGIDAAPLEHQLLSIHSLCDEAPFHGVDCALRDCNGRLLPSGEVRSIARRQSALRARSGELECWLLERCLQLAATPDAGNPNPRFFFWLTPGAGYDVLVARLLSLEGRNPPAPIVVGIPMPLHEGEICACAAVSRAARKAGFQVSLGFDHLLDRAKEFAEILRAPEMLCVPDFDIDPSYIQLPADPLELMSESKGRSWIGEFNRWNAKVIVSRVDTYQQATQLLRFRMDYMTGPALDGDLPEMD